MGSGQSNGNHSNEIVTEAKKKESIDKNRTLLSTSMKKTENVVRVSSENSDESSDNESFSLIFKHKAQNSSMKKGGLHSNANGSKGGNSELEWDSIIKTIDTDINEGVVIIETYPDEYK
ncbi:hypothetical protein HWI79_1495 [Cryptosporidium felis]|nr:hypothetical protein HWI79_1495 [Cryptosporidium felis]